MSEREAVTRDYNNAQDNLDKANARLDAWLTKYGDKEGFSQNPDYNDLKDAVVRCTASLESARNTFNNFNTNTGNYS